MKTPPDLPLNDAAFYSSGPFDTFRMLRDEHPIYWCRQGGFWAITRYEDVLAISRNHETFCNGQGMTMRGGELDSVKGGETLITTDPPQHTHQRKLVNRSFSQRAVTALEPHIRDVTRTILDEVPLAEPVDFVAAVASRLPVIVIAELLGVPLADRDKFVQWSNASVGVADPEYTHLRSTAMVEQYQYFESLFGDRRHRPLDDLLTELVQAEDSEDPNFGHADALSLCFLLLAAGNETTRNLISHSVMALSHHPQQQSAVRCGWDMARAVEELLRWVSPVIHMARTATSETEIRGQSIKAGDQVVMLYGAANRDDRMFGDTAEDLRLDRDPNPHLGFGFGHHFCLGAALARLEARVVFEEMFDRFRTWSIAGPVEHLHSTMVLGIKHMPLVLTA